MIDRFISLMACCWAIAAPLPHTQPHQLKPSQVSDSQPPESLPIPQKLMPQVEFWRRVYTEIDTSQGYLHDSHNLEIIYETVSIPAHLSPKQQARFAKQQVQRISQQLKTIESTLQHNKTALVPYELSATQQAILSKWPSGTPLETLATAAQHVRFQSGQRDQFLAGLKRARIWMPYIEQTLANYGLPRELAALPHVESSFDMRAYSKAKAAGIWQFMPGTARMYMMHVNTVIDERYDPLRATDAAARLLLTNYRRIGSWPLAITAYNHGTSGIERAVASVKSRDIIDIINHYHHRHFGFASRNFYAELLAAWHVSQHVSDYFGQEYNAHNVDEPWTVRDYEHVTTQAPLSAHMVAQALNISMDLLKQHNPALRPAVWQRQKPIPRGTTLRIPVQEGAKSAAERLALLYTPTQLANAAAKALNNHRKHTASHATMLSME